jgi:2-dehydro-3-deoxy-D-arabinonate dehydratase
MRLGQIKWNGGATAAIFNHTSARPIPDYTLYDLICRAEKEGGRLTELAEDLALVRAVPAEPLIPLQPREVWACGSTYASSAAFRDGDGDGDGKGMYGRAHREERPEIFFKGTARVCVGPGQAIGIRPDSRFTAPEPELAVVLGARGRVLGYTLANDVSAWDIERENPLYLSQSKTFSASCALGPIMVTADEIGDPRELMVSCTIARNGETIFSGEISTLQPGSSLERMVEFLMRANPVPAGSVLLTGTGIIVGEDAALAAGDSVTIRMEQIGELTNPAAMVP